MGNPCTNCIDITKILNSDECSTIDASQVIYTGPPLPCSNLQTLDNLNMALQKMDAIICTLGAPQDLQGVLETGNIATDIGAKFVSFFNPLSYTEILYNQVTSGAFVKIGGLSTEFLMADGSVNSSTFVTNLQQAYFGSTSIPQITVNDVLGALTLKTIRTLASSSIQEWWNNSDVLLAKITGEGNLSITPLGNVFGINVNATGTASGISAVTTGTGPGILATTTGPANANAIIAESGGVAAAMVLRASSLATTGNMLEVYDFSTRNAFITQEGFVNAQAFIKYLGLGTEYLMADGTVTTNADIVANIVAQTIVDGDITHAPAGNAVFDALALKANDNQVIHNFGDETKTGTLTVTSIIRAGGLSTQFLKADGTIDSTVYAPLNSPAFTGIPTAPTAAPLTNTLQLATTAFVTGAVATLDSNVVHKTGNESITNGQKSFSNPSGFAINASTGGTFAAIIGQTTGTGEAFRGTGASAANVFFSTQSNVGNNFVANQTTFGTGFNFVGQHQNVNTFTVDKFGNINSNSFIKSGGLVSQYLMADGSVSTISNFIAPTIVDGDVTHAPDGNSVFDALALKANDANVLHTTGNEVKTGDLTINGAFITNGPLTTNGALTVNGVLTATTLVKSGGTAIQYLMADGSVTTAANIIIPATQVTATPHIDYLVGANVQLQLDQTETNVVGLYKIDKTDDKTLKQTGRYRPDTDVSVLSISPADTLNITACDNILFVNEILPDSNANKVPDFLKSFGTKAFVANGTNTPLAANTRGIFYVGLDKLGNQVYRTAKIYDQDVAYLARILVNNTAGVYTIVSFKYFPDLVSNKVNNRDRFVLGSGYIVPSGAASISFGNRGMSYTKNSINYSNNKLDPNYLTIVDSVNPTPMSFLFFLPNITSLAVSIATSTVMDPTVWYLASGAAGGGAVNPTHYQVYRLFITVTGTIAIQTKASTTNAPDPGVNAIFATREAALAGLTSVVFPDVLPAGDSIALGTFYLRAGMAVNGSTMNDSNDFYFRPFNATASSSVVGVTTHDALSGKNDNPAFQHVTTTDITNWNIAYTNRITSLTTTGTSGAATLIANVLNIPVYAPQSGSANYIQNQNASAQSANMWISGSGQFGSTLEAENNIFIKSGSGQAYSSRLSTVLNFPNVDTFLDSAAGTSWTGRLNFRTSSNGGSLTTKMTILDSGNVGIGTTNPLGKLHVVGSSVISNIGNSSPALGTTAGGFIIAAGGFGSSYGLSTGAYPTGTFWMQSQTNDGSSIAYPIALNPIGGNVLIGTATDIGSYRLQVDGGVYITNGNVLVDTTSGLFNFRSTTPANNYGTFRQNDGSALAYLGDANGSAIGGGAVNDFAIAAPAGKLFLQAATNVILNGFGTTNVLIGRPTETASQHAHKLQIKGDRGLTIHPTSANPTGGITSNNIWIGEQSENPDYGFGLSYILDGVYRTKLQSYHGGSGNIMMLNPEGGSVSIGTTNVYSTLHVHAPNSNIATFSDGYSGNNKRLNIGTGVAGITLNAKDWDNGTVRAIMLNSDGGNVLIGTTDDSSGYKLYVNGNSYFNGSINSSTIQSGSVIRKSFSVNGPAPAFGNGRYFIQIIKASDGSNFISGKITISGYWHYSPVMGIVELETGVYVSINSTEINAGNSRIVSESGMAAYNATISDLMVVGGYVGFYIHSVDTNNFDVVFEGTISGPQYWNTTLGWESSPFPGPRGVGYLNKVGIGTTTPARLLEIVSGNSTNNAINLKYSAGYGNTGFYTIFDSGADAGNVLGINVNNAAGGSVGVMSLLGNGNVLIGTGANNGFKLRVHGESGQGISMTTNSGINTVLGSFDDLSYIGNVTGHPVAFYVAAAERMRLTTGGNLLIGTSTDSGYRLRVAGTTLLDGSSGGTTGLTVKGGDLGTGTTIFDILDNIGAQKIRVDGTGKMFTSTIQASGSVSGFGLFSGSHSSFAGATGNGYNDCAMEIQGNGGANTLFPTIGFHQPSLYAYTMSARNSGFYFKDQNGGGNASIFVNSINADGTITAASDARLKTNIVPLENSLDRVVKSCGVSFDRIDTGDKNQIGFIAQDLEKIFPELVKTDDTEEGMKSVNYGAMTAVLVEAIKEQQKIIKRLEKRIKKLESK